MSQILTFKGDLRGQDLSEVLGKDHGGKKVIARRVDYDPKTDTTEITVGPVTREEFKALVAKHFEEAERRATLKELFGG